jgi:hypothetical protein
MDFWTDQFALAQQQIGEIEDKIAAQQHKASEFHAQGGDIGLPTRLIAVMEESLARAKAHATYIDERIAAHKSEPDRRRRLAAARRSPVRPQARQS